MRQFFVCIISLAFLFACNTSPKNEQSNKASGKSKSFTWTQEDERDFLAGCVDNAKAKLGDTLAFAQCNCVLHKLKQNFPSLDSAGSVLSDSTKAAEFAQSCK